MSRVDTNEDGSAGSRHITTLHRPLVDESAVNFGGVLLATIRRGKSMFYRFYVVISYDQFSRGSDGNKRI